MMNQVRARKILGVKAGDLYEIVKSKYRSLAMQYHPDRPDGDQEKFKEIKEAYETLISSFNNSSVKSDCQTVKISLYEAFTGGQVVVILNGVLRNIDYPILEKPYTVLEYSFDDVSYSIAFLVYFDPANWDIGEDSNRTKGNISCVTEVSPFLLIMGGWLHYINFDSSVCRVYIPAGCKSGSILTLKNKGFWKNVDENTRGDCFLRIVPMIKKLEEYSLEEINAFKERLNSI